MNDYITDLLFKHNNKEDFKKEYLNSKKIDKNISHICKKSTNLDIDITNSSIEELTHTINMDILCEIYWMGRDKLLREEKLKRILGL
jgi:hypothetical protein